MVHRAVLGSLERFMGILIEHYGGAFPFWLSPVQISLIPVSTPHEEYAEKIAAALKAEGFRVDLQRASETLGSRIRKAQTEKIPYMMVMGDKEIQADKIALRSRKKGDEGQMTLADFVRRAHEEQQTRTV
jgi:threonyl-tRNA synthetase